MVFDRLVMVERGADRQFSEDGVNILNYGMSFFYPVGLPNSHRANIIGTNCYVAPEIRELIRPHTTQSDIWSVGCIGYELCLGVKLSLENRGLLKAHRTNGGRNPGTLTALLASIPPRFGKPVRAILYECLRWDPRQRCTAPQLHDFIVKNRQNRSRYSHI
jgi:serine/threonine protein kinase